MTHRIRIALLLAFALFASISVVIALSHHSRDDRSEATFAGSIRPSGLPTTSFSLLDQDGKRVSTKAFRGQPTVVTFMYSTCQDSCPVMTQQIRGALNDLGHDVPVIAVSVDPANDTPDTARRFLLRQHMRGRMHFLLGSSQQLQPIWRAFGIAPQSKGREHSAYVVLLDSDGHQRIGFPNNQITPERLAHDIRVLTRSSPPDSD